MQKPKKKFNSGFTLIELLVVISIIGLLASVVLVSLSTARAKARDTKRLADMRQIQVALELFFEDNDHYPGNAIEGVSNGGEFLGDDNGPIEVALSGYLTMPQDPLHDGITYYYSYDPQHQTDTIPGSCAGDGPTGAVLAFNRAETNIVLTKATCSGGNMNQNDADFNSVFLPAPN